MSKPCGLCARISLHSTLKSFNSFVMGRPMPTLKGASVRPSRRWALRINALEDMAYGIPLTAVGVNISSLETYEIHPDLKAIVELFGLQPDENVFGVAIADVAFQTGRSIAETLSHHAEYEWRQVGMALAWIFSCSGNSLIDYDMDELYEMESLEWTPHDIAFAIEMIAEADRMMAEVVAGLALLEQDNYRQRLKTMIRRGVRHD